MEINQSQAAEGGFAELWSRVLDAVRRRWLTLLLVSAAVFALGVALVSLMTPTYTAVARVRIDPARNPLGARNQSADVQDLGPEAIETEVTALSSVDVARAVVRKLRLQNDPEFTKGLERKEGQTPMSAGEREAVLANALLAHLNVQRERLTYILAVRFTSIDGVKAARLANTFAETYIESKVGSRQGSAQRQADWLRQRLNALGQEVQTADARVAAYRAQAGIVQGENGTGVGTITDQQVAPLSSQLATAESDAAAARSNLSAAQAQVARGGLDAVSEVLSSNVIADLRRQRAEVLRSQGEVQARYGERHPESIRVRDQISSIDSQIRDEATRVIGSLRASAQAAEARAASLRSSLRQLESERAGNTRAAVLADSLERDATAKRAAYDRMSQMSLDTTQSAQNSIAQAEIVDPAQAPASPTSPNRPLLYALSLVVALGAGAGTVAVQEMLSRGVKSTEELEQLLGVPVLAAVPAVAKTRQPADLLLEKPTSLFAESLRIARAAILGVRSGEQRQVIALTSALPSEGKTTTALAFARTLAANNARTLLLECDVRRAALRHVVRTPPTGPGTVELLHGEATLEQVITPGDVEGLDHLLVKEPYFSSEDLFGDGAMERLIEELRGRYQHIVLDLPPVVGLADGRFLAVLADAVVLLVRWNATPPGAVSSAYSWLKGDGANPIGTIFTQVDTGAEAIGGLYYSKSYSAYYQAA